ncbi:hypothetical protein FO519_003167 [Halicephalobus sp. NKZ332]|nr:hypothetical protein FO519_003167 [Halicephalobus sp. NKZ332]
MLPYYHDDRLPTPKRMRYNDETSIEYPSNPYTQIMAPNPSVQNPELKLNSTTLRECMENGYKHYCKLSLFYPKAVQKSYKVEKRLFCPPPALELSGGGWESYIQTIKGTFCPRGTQINQGFDLNKDIRVNVKVAHSAMATTQMDLIPRIQECYFQAKHLYISDSEKKKIITILADVNICGYNLGKIGSSRMKVMSKPSKKKQTVQGTEAHFLLIRSGSRIALYNRLRSQTISTRFLHVQANRYFASPSQWSVFDIYLPAADRQGADLDGSFVADEGFLCYGQVIRLVDIVSGVSLPQMTIRRVFKEKDVYQVMKNDGEPVSQLHMCAFELVDEHGNKSFLNAQNDNVVCEKEVPSREGLNHVLRDGARWTIASADCISQTFYPMHGVTQKPVAPFPQVNSIRDNEVHDGRHWLEIEGDNLSNEITVWFGTVQSPIYEYRSVGALACAIPSIGDFLEQTLTAKTDAEGKINPVPLFLARNDGVVYSTRYLYKYTDAQAGCLGRVIEIDEHEEQRKIFNQRAQVQQPYYSNSYTYNQPSFHAFNGYSS